MGVPPSLSSRRRVLAYHIKDLSQGGGTANAERQR